jgi:hypothetical protein
MDGGNPWYILPGVHYCSIGVYDDPRCRRSQVAKDLTRPRESLNKAFMGRYLVDDGLEYSSSPLVARVCLPDLAIADPIAISSDCGRYRRF